MDQDAYRKTYREINERACVYEKSILSGHCRCTKSDRFYLAEREGVHCQEDTAQQQCAAFIGLLRDQSRFVLKSNHLNDILSHAKSMKIQVGGMRGLYSVLNPDEPLPPVIEDIHQLLEQATRDFQTLSQVPLQPIIQQIAAYRGRRRGFEK